MGRATRETGWLWLVKKEAEGTLNEELEGRSYSRLEFAREHIVEIIDFALELDERLHEANVKLTRISDILDIDDPNPFVSPA